MVMLRVGQARPDDLAFQIDRFAQAARGLTRRELQRGARNFKSRMLRERLSGRPGLRRITGATARSLTATVTGTKDTLRLRAGIGNRSTPGVRIHEGGGIIRPKTKPWLAIPLDRTPGGRTRGRQKVDFWIRGKRNPANIVGMVVTGGTAKPVVVLVPSVTIPARLQFRVTFDKEMRKTIIRLRREYAALGRRRRK